MYLTSSIVYFLFKLFELSKITKSNVCLDEIRRTRIMLSIKRNK